MAKYNLPITLRRCQLSDSKIRKRHTLLSRGHNRDDKGSREGICYT